jgi:LmbE family N-acetylglucosaminyl deacetylase
MPVIDVEAGTPEVVWTHSERLRVLPRFSPPRLARVVVIAPHPDDETLGLGGTLSMLGQRGCQVEIVALTDGEASHSNASCSRAELAAARALERVQALTALDLSNARIIQLSLPDGGLRARSDLESLVAAHIRGADCCFAPFRRDGHPDHDAAGTAAARACEASGVPLVEYPIWVWHWSHPDREDLPWSQARCVMLSRDAQRAKAKAIRAYRTQVEPMDGIAGHPAVLPVAVLEHFARDFEVVFV